MVETMDRRLSHSEIALQTRALRTLVASWMLDRKLPQTRDGYIPKPSMRNAAE